jgi:uncharacterized protein YlxP (DUF503 family)
VVELHFPEAGSLKAKRKDLSSLKAQLQRRLGVAVSEVGSQNTWQRSQLACALTSGSMEQLERAVDRLEEFVLDRVPEHATFERHTVSVQDLREGVGYSG